MGFWTEGGKFCYELEDASGCSFFKLYRMGMAGARLELGA